MIEPTPLEAFLNDVASNKPTFALITSKTCQPCKRVKPLFTAAKETFNDFAYFHELDAHELPVEFRTERGIRSVPTLLMYKFGVEEHRLINEADYIRVGEKIGEFITEYNENMMGATRQIQNGEEQ